MEDEDELLDLFDKDEKLINTVSRVWYYDQDKKPEGYLRSTEMFIRNDKGQLWIPRRTAHKRIAPNGLDYSCGGHVTSGESYVVSLIREIEEELNFSVSEESLMLIKKFVPTEDSPWFRSLYIYESNVVPDYNHSDFQEYYWMIPDELYEKLKSGEPAKSSMLPTVEVVLNQLKLSS